MLKFILSLIITIVLLLGLVLIAVVFKQFPIVYSVTTSAIVLTCIFAVVYTILGDYL